MSMLSWDPTWRSVLQKNRRLPRAEGKLTRNGTPRGKAAVMLRAAHQIEAPARFQLSPRKSCAQSER
jgi:hypothetical protein